MLLSQIRQKHSLISFFVVLLSALSFRITQLDLIEFKADEAINLLLAARPLFGHEFVSGGTVSSLGVLNPPIFNYILFPIALISLDPQIASLTIALINVAAILGFYFLVKRYYSLTTATIASLLISFSPWSILYSRKIWMQDLLMPFTVLLLLSIHKLIIEKNEKYWILYTASSLILIQLHPISIVFISITSIFMFSRTKKSLKYIVYGILIGILPFIPYVIYQIQNGCPDCSSFLESRNRLNPNFSIQMLMRPFQILGVGDFRFILGDDTLTFAHKFPLIYKAREILYLEYLLLPLGFALFVIKSKKFSFLGYATLLTIASYFFLKIEPFMHYYIILLPLLFLFLATAFSFFIKSKNLVLRWGSLLLFLLIILISVAFNKAFFDLLRENGGTKGDYGSVYIASKKEKDAMLSKYRAGSDFQKRMLMTYIPLEYMYGYLPLGKMLYGNISVNDIPIIEKELLENPQDKQTQFKLLSFYTQNPETIQTIYLLREKRKQIPQYHPIYEQVLRNYMGKYFKKEYSSLNFNFFYPEHWMLSESNDGTIILEGDGYDLYIKNLGQNYMNIDCKSVHRICNNGTISEIKASIRPL